MHTPRRAYGNGNVSKDTLGFIESTSHTTSHGFSQVLADQCRECSQQAGPEHPGFGISVSAGLRTEVMPLMGFI